MAAHRIFDGDTVFLAMQQTMMQRIGALTHTDFKYVRIDILNIQTWIQIDSKYLRINILQIHTCIQRARVFLLNGGMHALRSHMERLLYAHLSRCCCDQV